MHPYLSNSVNTVSTFDTPMHSIGSRPSDHYFRSVIWFCLFVFAEFFSAVFDPISIKLGLCYISGSICVP